MARDDHAQNPEIPGRMIPLSAVGELEYSASTVRCRGCQNSCLLTVNRFSGGRRHISGNRCEKALGEERPDGAVKAPNVVAYKYSRIFSYEPLAPEDAPMGVIGMPRVLNVYENYPFWAVFFRELGFSLVLSPRSDRALYGEGIESSAMFWISGGLCVLAALISGGMYLVGRQKRKDRDDESQTVEG